MAKRKKQKNIFSSNTSKKYGIFEYGDIYAHDSNQPDGRGEKLGRLIVDQDSESFFCRTEDRTAKRLSREQLATLVAHELIIFDHADGEARLIDYLMKLEERKTKQRLAKSQQYDKDQRLQKLNQEKKIVSRVKRRVRIAKALWFLGCLTIVALAVLMILPKPQLQPEIPSIAGIGAEYPVDQNIVSQATYMTALGNGSRLFGLVFDDEIIESGAQNAGESTIKENVMVNANVSSKYALHLRPLYYQRNTFYQSQIYLDDANSGSTGVMLQNPDGYAFNYAANELVLVGGEGMSSVVISSPGAFKEISASDALKEIEDRQKLLEKGEIATIDDLNPAVQMPQYWLGYDYADIDNNRIAASYWYTKNSSQKREDLQRRVVVWDVSSVLQTGSKAVDSLTPVQLNYQDLDSNFYAPVISCSPASTNSSYWLGYMKQVPDGNTGFYIRRVNEAEDILLETYENTFSTRDITGTDFPITNYTLYGDYLFYEQQGYIWMINLSKANITVQDNERHIKKENPIQICKSNEIRPTVTRDEQFIASETGASTVPISHYQVMLVTTDKGVEYGISFIEADTGNLVFQPVMGATVAASNVNSGSGGDNASATEVSSGDQTYVDKYIAEQEAKERERQGITEDEWAAEDQVLTGENNQSAEDISQGDQIISFEQTSWKPTIKQADAQNGLSANANPNGEIESVDSGQGISPSTSNSSATNSSDIDTGRILIRPGSNEYQIICFCVRGEQFYWIEQSNTDNTRKVMVSPVFYKNDAMALLSESLEEETGFVHGLQASTESTDGSQIAQKDSITELKDESSIVGFGDAEVNETENAESNHNGEENKELTESPEQPVEGEVQGNENQEGQNENTEEKVEG